MNLHLPDAVQTYFAVSNGGDISRLAACFCADANVTDENRTHQGIAAIAAWQQDARQTFTYSVEPLTATQNDDSLSVTARLVGNFPGSPLQLNHLFRLQDGQIRSLEIAP
ncbi:nuclear transport factor 2 family protein [Pseudomonas sp. 32.2.56]|uniref:nuclear transport factor 2 family protein n=1 Tax=Pseudomonas sp. 32.2.56 TaxID=2969303 RepID=UPI00214FC7A5|nr:nuclear transport factor 2 family protein [Pseudomonas sp. 32.2.56]MCR4510644.1 nuclear transport factor 2 family protein [Pseudomonas sp. 32.2.56]